MSKLNSQYAVTTPPVTMLAIARRRPETPRSRERTATVAITTTAMPITGGLSTNKGKVAGATTLSSIGGGASVLTRLASNMVTKKKSRIPITTPTGATFRPLDEPRKATIASTTATTPATSDTRGARKYTAYSRFELNAMALGIGPEIDMKVTNMATLIDAIKKAETPSQPAVKVARLVCGKLNPSLADSASTCRQFKCETEYGAELAKDAHAHSELA